MHKTNIGSTVILHNLPTGVTLISKDIPYRSEESFNISYAKQLEFRSKGWFGTDPMWQVASQQNLALMSCNLGIEPLGLAMEDISQWTMPGTIVEIWYSWRNWSTCYANDQSGSNIRCHHSPPKKQQSEYTLVALLYRHDKGAFLISDVQYSNPKWFWRELCPSYPVPQEWKPAMHLRKGFVVCVCTWTAYDVVH